MLVLTRKPGEQLVIGGNIRVTIVSVGPGRVKIGIEAPPDVRIDRQEVHEKILHEQEQSADVLSAVTAGHRPDDKSPTLVAGSDTMQLHGRPRVATDSGVLQSPPPVNRVQHRLPRKPR
jgi:carbon storage regulator